MARRRQSQPSLPLSRGDRFVEACNRLSLYRGQPFVLDPYWEMVTREIFGDVDANGYRVCKRATITTGKKSGKTSTCSAWGSVLLTVDFCPGQSIVSISGSQDQAGNVYRAMRQMLTATFPKGTFQFSNQNYKITVVKGPSEGAVYRAIAAKSDTAHGLIPPPTVVIVDEAVFVDADLWQNVKNSMSTAVEPLEISISHADRYDPESTYQKQLVTARQIRDGIVAIPWWKVFLNELDPGDDWRLERNWYKANPTLGRIKKLDNMRRDYQDALRTPSMMTKFRNWELNTFTESSNAWLNVADWDRCATTLDRDAYRERLKGRRCVVGLDLSATQDLTAAVALFPPEGDERPQVLPMFFCPEDTIETHGESDGVNYRVWADEGWIIPTPGRSVDHEAVRQLLVKWGEMYRLELVGYDQALSTWLAPRLQADGIDCAPIGQGVLSLSEPTKALERRVLDGRIEHDGNPVMRWCIANAVVKPDTNGLGNKRLSKAKSTGRIDGAAALVDAMFCYDRLPDDSGSVDLSLPFYL